MPKTYSGVLGDDRCECVDSQDGHPVRMGDSQCTHVAVMTLWRIDMEDVSGTRFCEMCGSDAMDSGLFTDTVDDEDEEEE